MRFIVSAVVLASLLAGCNAQPFAFAAPTGASGSSALKAKKGGAGRDAATVIKAYHAALTRRDAGLVAEKYALIGSNDFSFFRGTAPLYYMDVAAEPGLKTVIAIPLQGDLHLENMGTYRTASGAVAFDLNDFDEAATGPYTWELARMGVSIRLAAGERGFNNRDELVGRYLAAYERELGRIDAAELRKPWVGAGPEVIAAIQEAQGASRVKFLAKLGLNGQFKLGKKVRAVDAATSAHVVAAVAAYAKGRPEGAGFFRVKGVASRVAGTASIGRYRYVAWIEGASVAPDDDVILEIKEQVAPASSPGAAGDAAKRVVAATRYFLPEGDALLGALRMGEVDFLVRELSPAKGGVELSELSRPAFESFLDAAAIVTARAHARSGKAKAIRAELGGKAGAIAAFADRYADQVAADREAFARSLKQ